MFDSLRSECFLHYVNSGCEVGIDVAALISAFTERVRRGFPNGRVGTCQGNIRIGKWFENVVVHLDQLCCFSCVLPGVGNNNCQYVACIRGAATDGDHDWPVFVNNSDHQFAWNVCCGVNRTDAWCFARGFYIDAHHIGTRMGSEMQGCVQHPVYANVIYITAIA